MSGNRIATYPAQLATEAAWAALPLQTFPPPLWTDISARATGPWSTERGTDYWLARTTAGLLRPVLDNRDGGLDPDNTAGPYAPNVQPYRGLRQRMRFGPNQLTADQASAGEASGLSGPLPLADLGVTNDGGYPLSIVASGSAFQGTQVYQATLPSGAAAGATVLLLRPAPVVPKRPYSVQAQVRITSGNSVSTAAAILWFDNLGNALGQAAGTAQTITSGSSTWIQLTASAAAAPAGAFSAQLKVQIASGTLTGSTVWQLDGLQWEQSATASTWQLPGTLGANLLPQPVATGTSSIDPTRDSAGNYFASAAGTIAQATNLTAAPNGATTAAAWTTPAGTTSSTPLYAGVAATGSAVDAPVADCTQVTAGLVYSASAYLMRTSSADATVQVTAVVRWYNAGGALISASNGTAVTVAVGSWVRATAVNLTAPAGAVWGRAGFFISSPASTTASNTIYATGWQLEAAAAASTWVDPGPTYFAWSGFFEQYPQTWRLGGTWGELDAVGVDALAGLAQDTVLDPLIEELLAYNPNFLYALGDPAGSTQCVDLASKRPPAPVENSPAGVGSLTFGNGVTSATPAGTMQGSSGPVATFNNSNTSGTQPETFVSLHKTTVTPGPPGIGLAWTRVLAFRTSAIPANQAMPWFTATPTYSANQSFIEINIQPTTGQLQVVIIPPSGVGGVVSTFAGNQCDGNWHLLTFGLSAAGTAYTLSLDGAVVTGTPVGGDGHPTQCVTDVLGCQGLLGENTFSNGFVGDLALAAEIPALLSSTQITNLYNSFRTASSGESSGARVARLLRWIGYNGPVSIDAGSTQTMGPASDLAAQKALSAFNAIVDTENGDGFVSAAGALTFKGRGARYNSSPLFVFGENTQFGEWPCRANDGDLLLPTDPVNVYDIIPTRQYSTGQVATARDAASANANFPRTFPTRTVNSTSFAEVQAAGQYLLTQLKTPRKRLAQMYLDVSAVPGLWRVAAQLEKGTRIRVMKRHPWRLASSPIQFDGFVERLEWSVDPRSGGAAGVRVEASPADPATYWVLAPLHTTLNAQALSGQNQATINALPDAAYNTLAQSLPQGQQFTFEPGTPRQETMTVVPGAAPPTTLGYTSATLAFTSNFTFTHAAGTVVTEPLPAGYTDPAAWDASSVLAAASTTVLSGGGAGTGTVTVGPLPDAATNPLGANWNTGDLLWLSPGTPQFEGYNLLSPNQATAGEGVLPLPAGSTGAQVGITADNGTPTVTASGSAFQGANVWQTSVAANAATPSGLLYVLKVGAAPGLAFTNSAYVRSLTTGANPVAFLYVKYLDASGNSLGQFQSANTTLTGSPTAAWTRLTATGTAPAGTVWAQLGVVLATAPTAAWTFQADGLQVEQNSAASVFCVTPQVLSVAASVPGYPSVQITLGTNLINSHNAGDTVCDPLPPGVTSPTTVAASTRVSY